MRNAKLEGLFGHILSTDRVQAYKPDPRAYRMGIDAFGLSREAIVFARSFEVAGAQSFGGGPLRLVIAMRYGVPMMKPGGSVVCISSAAGTTTTPWFGAYTAGKFGVEGLGKAGFPVVR